MGFYPHVNGECGKSGCHSDAGVFRLGTEARINYPSTLGNNWKWRLLPEQFYTGGLAKRIYRLITDYSTYCKIKTQRWKESKTGRRNKPEEIPAEQVQSLKERPAEYGTGNNQGHCPQM